MIRKTAAKCRLNNENKIPDDLTISCGDGF